jgi:hypothetical protein
MSAFHYRDGATFQRTGNGDVTVTVPLEDEDGTDKTIVIPPSAWASIVSSVAAGGEVSNYQAAVDLHAGRAVGRV